jgi:hypothetical protein
MTVALEATVTDGATFAASSSAASRPPRSGLSASHVGRVFANSVAVGVGAVVLWLVVLAMITLINDGLYANWS